MMDQPELGKRIAELRKAKGLTQEELVGKCNLSVRTLQRIESGEVTPRSYTVKTIFSALEFPVYESVEVTDKFNQTGLIVSSRLEQLNKYVLDLFNLKTNTMKKLIILSTPFLTVLIVLLFSGMDSKAQDQKRVKEQIETSHTKFMNYFNSGQIDSLSLLYATDATLMPEQALEINGRANIKEFYSNMYQQGFRLSENKSNSIVISDSMAVDKGVFLVEGDIKLAGKFMCQWGVRNNAWYIVNEISNAAIAVQKE